MGGTLAQLPLQSHNLLKVFDLANEDSGWESVSRTSDGLTLGVTEVRFGIFTTGQGT